MTQRRTYYGVQVLRGLAALLVVVVHVAGNLAATTAGGAGFHSLPTLYAGNGGVDLFFLISGFVIVWTTQDTWRRNNAWRGFLEKRATRIFPLYWLLTTGKILLVLAIPSLFRGTHLQAWNTAASYLLIPSWDAEGRISPVITAGWTLCFEMTFYYICTLCLVLRQRPIVIATPLFVALGLLGILRTPQWGALASLIDPLLLEFVAGMWIAELARRGLVHSGTKAMLALLALGIVLLLASDLLAAPAAYAARVLVWGVPAAMILYAVVALEQRFDFRAFRLPLLLGDASYSIYLTHVLVLPLLVSLARHLALPPLGEWAVFLALVGLGVGCGVLVWWIVERGVIRRLMTLSQPVRNAWINPTGRQA